MATKRSRSDFSPTYTDDSDSDIEARQDAYRSGIPDAWPRFLVVEAANSDQPIHNMSPFIIQKWFEGISSTGFSSIKKLRAGSFLVECSSKRSSDLLLKRDGSKIVETPIRVLIHRQLNLSKEVIRCHHLKGLSDGEMKSELSPQGVIDARRVTIKKNGVVILTNTILLTFATSKLPETIKIGYLRVKVSPFIPNPLRCFKCQKFGHTSGVCKSEEICIKCGKQRHEEDCKNQASCVNCEGGHQSNSKDCPRWKTEQEIQRVKTLERLFLRGKEKGTGSDATFPGLVCL